MTIIFTTRSPKKSEETLEKFQRQLSSFGTSFAAQRFTRRVHLQPENVDLTSLLSIRALCQKLLLSNIPKLDAVIFNAGVSGTVALNWPLAFYQLCFDFLECMTRPLFKIQSVGSLTQQQFPGGGSEQGIQEPPLGEVFCANVFGHYVLGHGLMSLLRACDPQAPGRLIWISSIDVAANSYNPDDFQGLESPSAYSHGKRLTDLLALSANSQPATAKVVDGYLDPPRFPGLRGETRPTKSEPQILVAHPGVCCTNIVPLQFLLFYMMVLASYLARWLGSPWHPVSTYNGAVSPVWLALVSKDELDEKSRTGQAKWGSAIDRWGNCRVEKTDVDSWGVDGSGKEIDWWCRTIFGTLGRAPGFKDATKEDVETFVADGARAWREMEELRQTWDGLLGGYTESQAQS